LNPQPFSEILLADAKGAVTQKIASFGKGYFFYQVLYIPFPITIPKSLELPQSVIKENK